MTGLSLTDAELDRFSADGFFVCPPFVPPDLLARLDRDIDAEIETPAHDSVVNHVGGRAFVTNIERPCDKRDAAVLELLGLPFILQMAEAICGADFFCIQEFVVVKQLGEDSLVRWHRDMAHERRGKCFTIGIYLDSAGPGDGALRVALKTHTNGRNICEMDAEQFTEVAVERGGALVHDMMLGHCSFPLTKRQKRRVIYFEFLSAAHVRAENIYSEDVIRRRFEFMNLALNYFRLKNPEKTPFGWKNESFRELNDIEEVRTKVREASQSYIGARPSEYCFEQI